MFTNSNYSQNCEDHNSPITQAYRENNNAINQSCPLDNVIKAHPRLSCDAPSCLTRDKEPMICEPLIALSQCDPINIFLDQNPVSKPNLEGSLASQFGFSTFDEMEDNISSLSPGTVQQSYCKQSGCHCVLWGIDKKKLKSSERVCVSTPFTFPNINDNIKYRLVLYPKETIGKGGSSFRSTKRYGKIMLKCENSGSIPDKANDFRLTFRFFVGLRESYRGPILHDFSEISVGGLPKADEIWDLEESALNKAIIIIGLEVLPTEPKNLILAPSAARSTTSAQHARSLKSANLETDFPAERTFFQLDARIFCQSWPFYIHNILYFEDSLEKYDSILSPRYSTPPGKY